MKKIESLVFGGINLALLIFLIQDITHKTFLFGRFQIVCLKYYFLNVATPRDPASRGVSKLERWGMQYSNSLPKIGMDGISGKF